MLHFFFKQVIVVAQRWPHTIDSLIDLKAKNNVADNLLKESNNQLQPHCLELFSNKRTLLKRDKELGFTKV
jgi:hypothetical protein